MHNPPDILTLAYKQNLLQDQLVVVHEKQQQIPGSVQYSIRRYERHPQWSIEDTGMLVYHFEKNEPKENYLELRFCFSGNVYCRRQEREYDSCEHGAAKNCPERTETIDVVSLRFSPLQLSQFIKSRKGTDTLTDNILYFRHVSSFSKILPLCGKTRMVLEALLNN